MVVAQGHESRTLALEWGASGARSVDRARVFFRHGAE